MSSQSVCISVYVMTMSEGNVFGNIGSNLEDLALLKRSQGTPSGQSKCLRKLR